MMNVPTPEPLQHLIERLQRHSALTAQDVTAIHILPRNFAIKPRKRDFRPLGEVDDRCYVVMSGRVAAFEQGRGGKRQLTSLYLPGQILNLEATVRHKGETGFVALRESHVIEFAVDEVIELAYARPAIGLALWRESVLDTLLRSKRMYGIAHLGAMPHTAHLICELAMRLGYDEKPLLHYDTALTQSDIAELIGITSVHVNRTLRCLREAGLASMFGGVVTIHNWSGLVELAEFDPSYLRLKQEAVASIAA